VVRNWSIADAGSGSLPRDRPARQGKALQV